MPSIQKIILALAFAATALSAQISDGQLQQPTTPVAVVKQITDGQLQQVTSTPTPVVTPAVVKQITDGQIQQVTTSTTPIVTPAVKQITDGQIQQVASASAAPVPSKNGTTVTTPGAPAATFTGAAPIMAFSSELAAVAVGAVAVFAML